VCVAQDRLQASFSSASSGDDQDAVALRSATPPLADLDYQVESRSIQRKSSRFGMALDESEPASAAAAATGGSDGGGGGGDEQVGPLHEGVQVVRGLGGSLPPPVDVTAKEFYLLKACGC
jgi:hypothetical protein